MSFVLVSYPLIRNQFPYIYVYNIDPSECKFYLKLVIFEFKETKIRFDQCDDSPTKVFKNNFR